MVLQEIVLGVVSGLAYGVISSVFIVFLAMIFKYFTEESFPWFISIIIGLGIVGVSGGLLSILDEPAPLPVTRVLVASLILVWATKEGDKLAARLPRKKISLISSLGIIGKQAYLAVRVPNESDINDIPGKARVSLVVKKQLSGREFILPSDLPNEELVNRVKRRLLTDWALGDVELELDREGRFTYFAVSAREQGLSGDLEEGFVAFPIKYDDCPYGLASGDIVRAYSGKDLLIDSVEIKGVNEADKTVTLTLDAQRLQNCVGRHVTQIVALPRPKKKLTVNEIMTRTVRTVRPDAALNDAISIMNERDIGSVIVAQQDRPIGILTDRDILQGIEKRPLDTSRMRVEDLMSEPVVQIPVDSYADEALAIMKNRNLKRLAVTSEGKLVGIVTHEDIFRVTSSVS
jgi:CBS domain-containing protein